MKTLLKVALALVLLILIVPAVLPSTTHVERALEIKRDTQTVYSVLADFNQFRDWNPWLAMEPSAKVEVTGAGVSSVYSWKGEKLGEGRMTLAGLQEPNRIQIDMAFLTPWESHSKVEWRLEPTATGTKVIWTMDQENSYFQRIMGLMMDGMVGKDFEKGLESLRKKLEG